MKKIIKRRICWPNPDAVCLEGGCIYCRDEAFQKITDIKKYCKNYDETCGEYRDSYVEALNYGLEHDFFYRVDVRWR